jgi:predicted lipase
VKEHRKSWAIYILIGIGIPLILFFFQEDGDLRFFSSEKVFERSLTSLETQEIKKAIESKRMHMNGTQRIIEEIKEKYRKQLGEDYYKERWIVHSIPYRYSIAIGIILFLIGIGKLVS